MNTTAYISEIFSSAQGEGVNIGRRQLFVRVCDCHRDCLYCDTETARTDSVRIETVPGSGKFSFAPNPLSPAKLLDLLQQLNAPQLAHADLFITGGEPLLQVEFLGKFIPTAKHTLKLPVHLETSGDLPDAFAKIAPAVDHILMDIKLPSVTGEPGTWNAHAAFLALINEYKISATIKLVVNSATSDDDLKTAADLIRTSQTPAAIVLQPMTAALRMKNVPTAQQILMWQSNISCAIGRGVRIIPQSHKMMGLL
ncbi:MAG: 7-carboxy-7-deazaguanine synthase QueE [Kiritimatiellales bacterium]